ncbi:MAG: glycine betaine/L-proline ABC transporter ATP-binding protein [Chloroflexales bacterium]|nr:glycine betaine/L-proline ABC transporter ATP-binding protein [Chloroflexales bacterium]
MVFGKNPYKEALALLQQGVSKAEILDRTGSTVGVANVSFSVQEGEIFVVMGLSGSGKSTLIRCLNRLIEPTSGQVYIDGENVLQAGKSRLRELRRTKMAMVFQHFALLPHKTVAENVAYGLKIRGVDEEERRSVAISALDMVGLKQYIDQYPKNLSGGMQQRVGLARALATNADILLMDEAFSALDPLIRRQMQNELLQLQKDLKKTVVFITHDLNEALRIGNHVAIMRDGKIIQVGNPVEIITQPANDYVAAFMQDVDQSRVLTAEVVMQDPNYVVLGRDAVQTVIKRAKAKDAASAFYVVNNDRRLEGFITRQNIMRMEKDQQHSLDPFIERDCPVIPTDTTLTDMYALVANGVPVAVVDQQGRLVGEVHASDVLSSLASVEQVSQEQNNGMELV